MQKETSQSAINLIYAYAHAILDDETIKLTRFSSEARLSDFVRGFYGPKSLPNNFTQ